VVKPVKKTSWTVTAREDDDFQPIYDLELNMELEGEWRHPDADITVTHFSDPRVMKNWGYTPVKLSRRRRLQMRLSDVRWWIHDRLFPDCHEEY
jgi:hypothetical protein